MRGGGTGGKGGPTLEITLKIGMVCFVLIVIVNSTYSYTYCSFEHFNFMYLDLVLN